MITYDRRGVEQDIRRLEIRLTQIRGKLLKAHAVKLWAIVRGVLGWY